MVNHFRTGLLNLAPAATPDPGEEYVPADYRPADLPRHLAAARTALFGAGADRAGANLTLARITAYLHASRFAADAARDDPRVTYDPARPAGVWSSLGAAAATLAGTAPVGWSGAAAFRHPGRAYGVWDVETDGAGGYAVTPRGGQPASGPVAAGTLGDAVPLPGSHLGLVVGAGAAGRWSVSLLAPPAHRWASAAAHDATGVFDPDASAAEAGWFAAWSDAAEPAPLRACALALAVSARVHELAAAGGG